MAFAAVANESATEKTLRIFDVFINSFSFICVSEKVNFSATANPFLPLKVVHEVA